MYTEREDGLPLVVLVRLLSVLASRTDKIRSLLARELNLAPTDLRALYHVGDHPDVTPRQLADHLEISTGSMTPVLDRLEQRGYLERVAHATDRRSVLLRTTPAGAHAHAWVVEQYQRAIELAMLASPELTPERAGDLMIALVGGLDRLQEQLRA